MSKFVSMIVALGLALGFTAPAFSAGLSSAKTKAECKQAGGAWDKVAKICKPKM
jgi:hypothetical protein